jgi:ribosomal protein L37AE/L43A
MVAYKDLPDTLKPYHYHGVNLEFRPQDKNATADCPWCGRENKFSISIASGMWQCFVCKEGSEKGGGNAVRFAKKLWEQSVQQTSKAQYKEYADSKGILFTESLKEWGVCFNKLNDTWIAPGYGLNRSVATLYKYSSFKDKENKVTKRWLPTPTLGMKIYGLANFAPEKPVVYICEGIHDGICLYEALKYAKVVDESLVVCEDIKESLLADANVIAIPGCEQWQPSWNKLVVGKEVRIMFDNDYPVTINGVTKLGAGYAGSIRTATLLYHENFAASSVEALVWGSGGHEESLPDGHDVRDFLRSE